MSSIAVFVKVVDEQGFSSAARALGLSTSYVSRQLSALESRLGVRLLNRSTRRLSLTPVGALFYRNCSSVLAQLEEAELAVTQLQTVPRGLLRVSAPEGFGRRFLPTLVADFTRAHEELEVQFTLDARPMDPVEDGYDVVLRLGEFRSNRLITRKLVAAREVFVASPAYLARHGAPSSPDDLSEHRTLYCGPDPATPTWELVTEGRSPERYPVQPALATNNDDVLLAAATAGRGIALAWDYVVEPELRADRLRRVLPNWSGPEAWLQAMYAEQKHLSAKVRLFVDFLATRLGAAGAVDEIETEPLFGGDEE